MSIKLNSKAAFINAVKTTDRPVAFLLGSPLSQDAGGGVPGVVAILDLVRDEIRGSRIPGEIASFENELLGKSGEEAYQTAMQWLQANLTQDAVNRVVARAVRQARRPGAPPHFHLDGDAGDWYLTQGARQLGELVAREQTRFTGPILTTNFDPLIFLAVEAAGRRAHIRVIDSDGNVGPRVEQNLGAIDVVHLHGYWRDSDTLHTPDQLVGSRPNLKSSLQNLLRVRTLVVVAYGGWDDVFAAALAQVLNDDEAKLRVFWCFYETDQTMVEARYKKLLARVAPAVPPGRFVAYGGIDCHSIFAELADFVPAAAPAPAVVNAPAVAPAPAAPAAAPAPGGASPLAGWDLMDSARIALLTPLRPGEVVRYFDGAMPTWRHAVSEAIPRREWVSKITQRLSSLPPAGDDCSLQLVRAAGGEGKSTLLLQAAADVARMDGWAVLWRPSYDIGLPPEHVVELDARRQWLVVADDAENLVRDLTESARLLHEAGRANVHFLLAARDMDWIHVGGDEKPWGRWLTRPADISLRGIKPGEAQLVVEAWQKYGDEGLRGLASRPPAERTAALERAVVDASRFGGEGSLFGGLLDVRFGREGLQSHVRDFLRRLKQMPIQSGGGSTLFDAIVYVAACHGVGIPGLDADVLAELVSVPREWVNTLVVRPLGEEATAVQSAGHVFTRHGRVAAAILVEAEKSFGVDLAEVWTRLVHQTVSTVKNGRARHPTFMKIVRAGTSLMKSLPQQLSEARRREIAVAAARADVAAESERLASVIDLGKTYRSFGDHEAAAGVFRDNLAAASAKVKKEEAARARDGESAGANSADFIRSYWYEWSVCEGERGKEREHALADAWLGGVSVSDHLNPAPMNRDRISRSCSGLGVAFGKLARPGPDCPYAKARRAVTFLGRLIPDDPKGAAYYDKYDREADKLNTPRPWNMAQAVEWLTAGVAEAGRELKDDFLAGLAESRQVSFKLLQTTLVSLSAPPTGKGRPRNRGRY